MVDENFSNGDYAMVDEGTITVGCKMEWTVGGR